MGHPQNSARGLFAKLRLAIGAQELTYNSTSQGLTFSNPVSAKPSTDQGATFTVGSNSTGVFMALNSTGTTWKYLSLTSVQPT